METDQAKILTTIQRKIIEFVADILKRDIAKISLDNDLIQYGFDSITFTELSKRLNLYYGISLTPTLFYQYLTTNTVARYLLENCTVAIMNKHGELVADKLDILNKKASEEETHAIIAKSQSSMLASSKPTDGIAIIGMAGIFPGAADVNSLWNNLMQGYDAITHFPAERMELNPAKSWIDWGGFIKDIDKFDAEFFKIFPREAELMDPQQRIFLMTVYKSIEDAGYAVDEFNDTLTSLFVGVGTQDYFELLIQTGKIEGYTLTGMAHNMLPNRVSYLLGLKGTSVAIDTACSSSLVAIHRAVQAIEKVKAILQLRVE